MLLMKEICNRIEELGFTVEMTSAAADHFADVGYDPNFGARPLRRVLQRRVENELSKRMLRGEYRTGDKIMIDYDPNAEGDNKITFTLVAQEPIAIELPMVDSKK